MGQRSSAVGGGIVGPIATAAHGAAASNCVEVRPSAWLAADDSLSIQKGREELELSGMAIVPVESGPTQRPEVYLSYAWGDDATEDGRRRNEIADGVERCAIEEGWTVHRDKRDIAPGGSISEFMGKIQHGGLVIVVLSERYLQRVRCMAELHGIYLDSRSNEQEFRKRIVPVVLDDAYIGTMEDRLWCMKYWEKELQKIKRSDVDRLGAKDRVEHASMKS